MAVREKAEQLSSEMDSRKRTALQFVGLDIAYLARRIPKPAGGHDTWHEIDVRLEGPEEIRRDVVEVVYHLHPSFPEDRVTSTKVPDFSMVIRAWGEFTLRADVQFRDGRTVQLAKYLEFRT